MAGGEYFAAELHGSGVSERSEQDGLTRVLKINGFGAYVGDQVPGTPLKISATYFLDLTLADTGDYNKGGELSGETGFRLGAGLVLNKYMTLSLEYLGMKVSRPVVSYPSASSTAYVVSYSYGPEDIRVVSASLGCHFDW